MPRTVLKVCGGGWVVGGGWWVVVETHFSVKLEPQAEQFFYKKYINEKAELRNTGNFETSSWGVAEYSVLTLSCTTVLQQYCTHGMLMYSQTSKIGFF